MTQDYFREVVRFFKNCNLVAEPINVRRLKLRKGLDGLCEKQNNKFVIKVNINLSENYSIDVLIHEIAHVIAWDKDIDVHGLNWGKAYSKAYRMFLEEFRNE